MKYGGGRKNLILWLIYKLFYSYIHLETYKSRYFQNKVQTIIKAVLAWVIGAWHPYLGSDSYVWRHQALAPWNKDETPCLAIYHLFPYCQSTWCPNRSGQSPRCLYKRPGFLYDFTLFYFVEGQVPELSQGTCTQFLMDFPRLPS